MRKIINKRQTGKSRQLLRFAILGAMENPDVEVLILAPTHIMVENLKYLAVELLPFGRGALPPNVHFDSFYNSLLNGRLSAINKNKTHIYIDEASLCMNVLGVVCFTDTIYDHQIKEDNDDATGSDYEA